MRRKRRGEGGRGEEEGRGEGGRKTRREEVHVWMYNVRGKGNNLVPSSLPSSSQTLQSHNEAGRNLRIRRRGKGRKTRGKEGGTTTFYIVPLPLSSLLPQHNATTKAGGRSPGMKLIRYSPGLLLPIFCIL